VADGSEELLTDLLKQVSRSFYLTLRVLPMAVRPQIGLAYLLARTTDTIADTEILPPQERLNALGLLRARIFDQKSEVLNFSNLAQHQGSSAERSLLEQVGQSLALLATLSEEDRSLVRQVIDTITSGQELDLLRFNTSALTPALSPAERENMATPVANPTHPDSAQRGNKEHPLLGERAGVRAGQPTNIIALQTDAELDDYTYRVAGCVGEFWTKMCRAHLFPEAKLDDLQLLRDGVRFGKGLQLVNILRDLPRDLQQGRCYIPAESLTAAGLSPADLLDPRTEQRFRPIYDALLDRAEAHLAAGWNYTNSLPGSQYRVRLACALPVLIGVRTLERLRRGRILDNRRRIKVSRGEVNDLLLRTLVHLPCPTLFRDLWHPRQKPGA
jgi:farnesyl-diphosphate farnesyltransferase